ncbi:alpha/beta hydrolase [Winogradskyella litorisediminis]|uniref:Alpha/beta hydrolase n=1 Tax=Winogradskyella litorisediminis TaxID=1156618 RepID=A0ABW3NA23_9FLAO
MKQLLNILFFLLYYLSFGQTKIVSEEYLLKNDSIKLPGTLTYNEGLSNQPLVIFVQGSGNPDRNGNQPALGVNIDYIKLLRDELNKKGIAFYSYDKRNVTKSNFKHLVKSSKFEDLVEDTKKATENFENDNRFSTITLIGHSQGSLVAMLAIEEDIDKYISLSGLGESFDKALIRQISAQNEALGKTAELHFKELNETGDIKNINPMLLSLFSKPNLSFLKSYSAFDPAKEIAKLEIPVLIVNGNKDLQVLVNDAQKLKAENSEAELVIIDGMTHVLKTITTDDENIKTYTNRDFPLSLELVEVISAFIKK